MQEKKRRFGVALLNFVLFAAAILLFGNTGIRLHIKHAYPFLILSLLTAYSCFSGVSRAALAGFLSGAFIDSVASGSYCFNTLAFMLLAVAASRLSSSVFNKNLKACITLCFLVTAAYYLLYWIIFIAFSLDFKGNSQYLLQYALPSCIYTTVFVIPFYFLYKKLLKRN